MLLQDMDEVSNVIAIHHAMVRLNTQGCKGSSATGIHLAHTEDRNRGKFSCEGGLNRGEAIPRVVGHKDLPLIRRTNVGIRFTGCPSDDANIFVVVRLKVIGVDALTQSEDLFVC